MQEFEGFTPRAGNDSGGGQLGNAIKCKPGGINDYLYVVVQEHVWEALARRIGGDELVGDPRFAEIGNRRKNQAAMWQLLEGFASQYTKQEFNQVLNEFNVPCGPVMSTEDLANDEHVRLREMYVEVDHPERGKYWNLGCPMKLSDSPVVVERSPLLGEHIGRDPRRRARLRGGADRRLEGRRRVQSAGVTGHVDRTHANAAGPSHAQRPGLTSPGVAGARRRVDAAQKAFSSFQGTGATCWQRRRASYRDAVRARPGRLGSGRGKGEGSGLCVRSPG